MLEYMFNNLSLIDKYQSLYKNGIDKDIIKKSVFSGELSNADITAHSRFRIFLDNCLLLLNKEKMTNYMNSQLSFRNYFSSQNYDNAVKAILDVIRSAIKKDKYACNLKINDFELFYSFDGNNDTPWHQGDIIRRAAAHAQYSTFVSNEYGFIFYFYVDNIDEKKDIHGIVIEELFHRWVKAFFSNYSTIGIPYKHTCISNYSFLAEKGVDKLLWVSFKISKSYNQSYFGNSHPLKDLGMKFTNIEELKNYVKNNKNYFEIDETPLFSLINSDQIKAMQMKYELNNDATTYGIKSILDPETELSNFIVHLSLLNDVILNKRYSDLSLNGEDKLSSMEQLGLQLDELDEDKNANLAFRLGFLFLKAMNFAFRTEKNKSELEKYGKNTPGIDLDNIKYPVLDYSKVDISGFVFNPDNVEDFCQKEGITNYKNEYFVVKKLRNSLMHGNIRFKMDCNNGVVFIFDDIHNKRINTIEINEKDLDKFLKQKELYNHISSQGIKIKMAD